MPFSATLWLPTRNPGCNQRRKAGQSGNSRAEWLQPGLCQRVSSLGAVPESVFQSANVWLL